MTELDIPLLTGIVVVLLSLGGLARVEEAPSRRTGSRTAARYGAMRYAPLRSSVHR